VAVTPPPSRFRELRKIIFREDDFFKTSLRVVEKKVWGGIFLGGQSLTPPWKKSCIHACGMRSFKNLLQSYWVRKTQIYIKGRLYTCRALCCMY
jgi:hypothetical protein